MAYIIFSFRKLSKEWLRIRHHELVLLVLAADTNNMLRGAVATLTERVKNSVLLKMNSPILNPNQTSVQLKLRYADIKLFTSHYYYSSIDISPHLK